MGVRDERLRARVRNRPQHARGLRYREREVEPGDDPPHPALVLLSLDHGDRLRTRGWSELGIECRGAFLDPLGHRPVLGVGAAERCSGDRGAAHADEELELGLGDLIALRDLPAADPSDTSPQPPARRSALGVVIPRQRGRERPVAVAGRDRAQQVLVAVARAHHAHRNRHHARLSRRSTTR